MYGGGFGDNFGVIVGDVEALGMDHPRWANITRFLYRPTEGRPFQHKIKYNAGAEPTTPHFASSFNN
jgi:hypothetical protein